MGFFVATDVTLTIEFMPQSLSAYREAILDELSEAGPSTWSTLLFNVALHLSPFDRRLFQSAMWALLAQNVVYRVEYNSQNRRYQYGLT